MDQVQSPSRDLPSLRPSVQPSMKSGQNEEKSEYDAQIYMTIGQADPHPSLKHIHEMSGSIPMDS